ncbi:MAG: response regulator, partial [Guyparkeria sp.]
LDIASREGEGCRIRMTLPVSLATTKVVLLQLGERLLALPTEVVVTTGRTRPEAIVPVGGRMSLNIDGDAVPVIRLANALEIPRRVPEAPERGRPVLEHYLIIAEGERRAVLLVDDVLEEQQVIVKPPGAFIRHLRCIAGACILRSGDIAMVLRTTDLLTTPTRSVSGDGAGSEAPSAEPETVLLVEDSAVTRIQEKRILENAGYRVVPATDGQEALERLEHADIDLVVTDISMPRMDGLALTAHIRKHPRHHQLPVILMTMLDRKEDRQRGLEAGADAYLMKTSFDQNELLDTVRRLL